MTDLLEMKLNENNLFKTAETETSHIYVQEPYEWCMHHFPFDFLHPEHILDLIAVCHESSAPVQSAYLQPCLLIEGTESHFIRDEENRCFTCL